MKFHLFILVFIVIGTESLFAQRKNNDVEADSVYVQRGYMLQFKDSTLILTSDTTLLIPRGIKYRVKKTPELKTEDFYNSLEDKSEKKWITKQLYDVLIVNSKEVNKDTIAFLTTEQTYSQYKGWNISKISYKQVEIIAGNVDDTLQVTNSKAIRVLNDVKSPTRLKVLQKNTIIKINDLLEPNTIADNERLLRELPYIVESRIYVKSIDSLARKVELIIVTQDQFSIGAIPSFSSPSKFSLGVYDRNAFGTGTQLGYTYAYEKDTLPKHGTIASFSIDNIAGTFTNGRIEYRNLPGIESFIIDIGKRFITPETKLGGGITFTNKDANWRFVNTDTSLYIPYSGNFIDVWAGYSPQIFSVESRRQFVFSTRYNGEKYFERPLVESDSNEQFANSQLIIASATYRKINYKKSKLLVGFGRAEDVPIGESVSLTSGYGYSELVSMPYFGLGSGLARYTSFGILGFKFEIGGFRDYDNNKWRNGALAFKLLYYSPLYIIKKFTFRTSLRISTLHGIGLPSYKSTNINDVIRGISGTQYYGQDKLAASLETVSFTPWYVLGFRFAIYAFADIGFLGFNEELISKDHLYSGIGVGVRIRNENLVFRTIQLRFTFYSLNPEGINDIRFDINTTDNYLFNAIEVGKPDIVQFK